MQYWEFTFKSAGLEERREGVEGLKVTSTTDSVDKQDNPLKEDLWSKDGLITFPVCTLLPRRLYLVR